jgi:GT2 family glycosyltransferase
MHNQSARQSFSAFIITFERASILKETISSILSQTNPPEKILIVDNSASFDTQELIAGLSNIKLEYVRMGYNAGPAGAAKIGLEHLTKEGFSWVVWCDDDDPPKFEDSFEVLRKTLALDNKIGIAGAVGSRFNWRTGFLKRLNDNELKGQVPVDSVAGGMVMFINTEVIKLGVLPDEALFFGFEELDFCLRVKQAGFKIVVNGELAWRYREASGRLDLNTKTDRYKGWKFQKSKQLLWREYYSTRNMTYLLFHKYKKPFPFAVLLMRVSYKMISGFKAYKNNGMLNIRILLMGLRDGLFKKMGHQDGLIKIIGS